MFNTAENNNNNVASIAAQATAGKKPKADAFVNISLLDANGNPMKLGYITFTAANSAEAAAIIKRLESGGDEALASFKEKLLLDFRMARTEARVFDF